MKTMNFLKNIFSRNKTKQDLYDKSVNIFIDNFDNPDIIKEKINELTSSENDTQLIYLFIPHFFCQLFIPEVEYTDYYIIENKDNSKSEIKFTNSKLLTELFDSIKENWDTYLTKNFMNVLVHSGDFRAINEAMQNGIEIEKLKALPPTIGKMQDKENENTDTKTILELMFLKASKKIDYIGFQKHFLIEGNDFSKAFFNIVFTYLVLEIPKKQIVLNIKGKLEELGISYSEAFILENIIANKEVELKNEINLYREVIHMQNEGIEEHIIIDKINTFR